MSAAEFVSRVSTGQDHRPLAKPVLIRIYQMQVCGEEFTVIGVSRRGNIATMRARVLMARAGQVQCRECRAAVSRYSQETGPRHERVQTTLPAAMAKPNARAAGLL